MGRSSIFKRRVAAALVLALAPLTGVSALAQQSGSNCSATTLPTQFDLGYAALDREDYVTAYRLWHRCAEEGSADAQLGMGAIYFYGYGRPKDLAEAARWYLKSAEQGSAKAQYFLGVMYEEGDGVAKDAAAAVSWFRKAAEQGHPNAQHSLAMRYFDGHGVAQDKVEAVRWFHMAAAQGVVEAQANLGTIYLEGQGAERNQAEARNWFRKAAEQGDSQAQFDTGVLYYTGGDGQVPDNVQAYMWTSLSASSASNAKLREKASDFLETVAEVMTPEQIARATALVKAWKPNIP